MTPLRRTFAIVALALVLAPLSARAPLFDPDEGLHAAIAQEMVRTGDYVTPRFLGEPFLDKPILFFWAEALSLRVFGMNEAAVRIPPLVFGLLGMIGVALLGRTLFGETAGIIAGVVYGTMLLPLGVSELAVHDVAVVPFMCAAIWCLLQPGRLTSVVGAGVFLGLSILTKGLVAIAFAGIFAVCYSIARPSMKLRLATALAIAIAVAAAVAAPWYLAMERAHPGYLYYYFIERHLQGYLTSTQRHAGRVWWYYVPIVVGGTLPWTGYLVGAARIARADRLRLVVWGWLIAGFLFLSAGESKLATYALPLFAPLALLVGDSIASASRAIDRLGYVTYAVTLAILPPVGLLLLWLKFGWTDPRYWLIVGLVSAAIAFVAIPRPQREVSRRPQLDFTGAAPRLSLMALLGLMILVPRAAAWMTSRDIAFELNSFGHLPSRVLVVEERIGSLIFYLDPALRAEATPDRIDRVTLAEAIQRSRTEPLDAAVIVRNNLLQRFERQFAAPPVPDATAGTWTMFRVESLRKALQDVQR